MVIYVILLFLVVLYKLLFLDGHFIYNRRYFLFASFFTMTLILGLRGAQVGEDTVHYTVTVFDALKKISWKTVLTHPGGVVWSVWGEEIEYLFAILYKVVQSLSGNGQVFIFVVALLTCHFFARFIYRSIPDHVFFATLVFICDALFMGAFNGIRQMLALSIALNAYEYMKNSDYKKVVFLIVSAFFIHSSAVIMVPFLLLLKVKDYRRSIICVFAVAVVLTNNIEVMAFIVGKLIPKYSIYFVENYWTNSVRGTLLLWAMLVILSSYLCVLGIKNSEEYFGVLGAILYITVEVIGLRIAAFTRISYYFRAFLMMLFPMCGLRFRKKSRIVYYIVIFILLFAEYMSYASVPSRQYYFGSVF